MDKTGWNDNQLTRRRVLTRGGAVALGTGAAWATPWSAPLRAGGASGVESEWLGELPLLETDGAWQLSELIGLPGAASALGVRAPEAADVRVRTADAVDGEWSPWRTAVRTVDEAPDLDSPERTGVTPRSLVWVGEAGALQVAVANGSLDDVRILVIDSVGLGLLATATRRALGVGSVGVAASGTMPAAHAAGMPAIITRDQWGAARGGSPSYASGARYAVVHHTVTSNNYSRGDAPGIVRSIQHYHMRGNGWKDIGYHFLVDRHGQIFEGRGGGMDRPVIGAHAAGFNEGSVGIALIGDHRNGGLTEAAVNALRDLLAWLCSQHGIDPQATTVETSSGSTRYPRGGQARFDCICGHRNASKTSCPGDVPYHALPDVRRAVAAALGGATSSEPVPRLPRLGGQDGIATAVLVSKTAFGDGEAAHAVVTNDRVFVDAAAAGPLAGPDGPVLLTRPDGLDARVDDELARVLPDGRTVYLLGGPNALSPEVEHELADRWVVRRIAGADRTSTAALVAERVVAARDNRTALVTRAGPDSAWADALAAGAYGARYGTPLLLTDTDRLSPATRAAIRALRIKRTIVVGGPDAVSDHVMRQLPNSRRVAGSDRAATAAAVAHELWGVTRGVVVASGYHETAWKDPLAVAPLAARREAPVVVVDSGLVPPATAHGLQRLSEDGLTADDGLVVGGRAAVGDSTAQRCAQLLGR